MKDKPMQTTCPNTTAHEWVVFSTILQDCYLFVQCVQCGLIGIIDDPTTEEWSDAFHAPNRPYRWTQPARVKEEVVASLRVVPKQPGQTCDCIKAGRVLVPADYERVPDGITDLDRSITEEERLNLQELANLVADSDDLCSGLLPLFIRSFQEDTGSESTAAVRLVAERIEQWHRVGLHQSPGVVAKILRDVAR